ncbi:MAG TPA: hypothetical protein VEI57_18375 [Nitrospirota bacterium]|nr:hypothetical protein [Nitrospirota bacterium]
MRATIVAMAGLLALTIYAGHARSEALQSPSTEPYPAVLQVDEIFQVCKSGEVICPVTVPICDDLKVVNVVDTPEGLGFKGISPGTTLCSVMSMNGIRRVFRITVQQSLDH